MTQARYAQVRLEDTPFYHCYTRCVRRAFLCGFDRETGGDFEHRRQWIVVRMKQLASVFCMDICAYAVMSNHYHVVLRVDAEEAHNLTDIAVLQRWQMLFAGNVLVTRYLSEIKDTHLFDAHLFDVKGNNFEKWVGVFHFSNITNV